MSPNIHRLAVFFTCAFALVACSTPVMNVDVPNPRVDGMVMMDVPTAPVDIPSVIDPCRPLNFCNGVCVNFQTDRHNCGSCDNLCNGFYTCEMGRCVPTCPMGQTQCGGLCVTLTSDTMNCGACGRACPGGLVCRGGQCDIGCAANLSLCTTGYDPDPLPDGGLPEAGVDAGFSTDVVLPPIPDGGLRVCAEVATDRRHCGRCNNACGVGETCIGGRCQIFCPPGNLLCNGMCINPMLDSNNCGMCGRMCAAGTGCEFGSCQRPVCPMGQSMCMSGCADLQNNPTNCGACQRACPAGQACIAGVCTARCPMGQTDCMGRCLDLQTDTANCGACARACPAGSVCTAGACAVQCAMGNVLCGGRCVTTSVDPANCGACGTMCQVGGFCSGGACMRNCSGGLQMCGASCVDFLSDNLNCGACGMACPATDSCVAGVCRRLGMVDGGCNPPSLQCGPVCTNIQSDNNNCGRCGAACAGDRLCLNGACVAPCVVGQLRCGAMGACVDTLRDNNNCGACGNVCAPGRPCTAGRCGTYDAIPLPAGVAFIDACALAGHMEVLAGADDSFVLSPIPFAFRYFNTMLAPNAMINVVSNGWIGMDGVGTATYNFPIPQVAVPNSVVAPYEGDNQNEGAQCIATVGVAPMRQWVVQWNHAHHCCGAMAGVDLTYEVVLSETTNTIDFIYRTMTGARAQAVGIENETGTIAVGGCPMGATNCAPSGPASSIRFRPVP